MILPKNSLSHSNINFVQTETIMATLFYFRNALFEEITVSIILQNLDRSKNLQYSYIFSSY